MDMRTRQTYEQHLEEAEAQTTQSHVFGVKQKTVLNDCIYFHVLANFSLDIMHDLLEGIVQYELKLVLEYFIYERQPPLLSQDELNQRVASHCLNRTDNKNKPSFIKLRSARNDVGQKAMQAWCLIRNLPFIIAQDIEEGNVYWELLLRLLDCMDIIFAPQLTAGLIAQLSILTEEHHTHFQKTFPDRRLLPKHHFMVHYPTCLREVGPLIHVWCMRYEAKHHYFGRVAESVRNYKNICKSLAKKHQTALTFHLQSNHPLEYLEVGPGSSLLLSDLDENIGQIVQEQIQVEDLSTELFDANWVKVHGTHYQLSLLVCHDVSELPLFGQIEHIIVHHSTVFFVLVQLDTVYYNSHYHAYAVEFSFPRCHVVKNQKELVDYKPLDLMTTLSKTDSRKYVAPRHVLFK
ncbi:uncharacterized protein LOC115919721 [Strongylocentrotus purpuratus]|uniref:Uncharacterized protein n=1 Tax=Strongylocentrotus purpuratus TaxID=7668 RepID=A0A7M7ST58_STRPU|nr:uncharacterized protein LOC115919721 [Strongylocentrotus purpuratus]